jgi:two-component system, NtrC family, response regulator GlrR
MSGRQHRLTARLRLKDDRVRTTAWAYVAKVSVRRCPLSGKPKVMNGRDERTDQVPAGLTIRPHSDALGIAPANDVEERGSARERRIDGEVPARFGRMVGASSPMLALFAILKRAAASDATVLIDGETGTGKEVSAQAIHDGSARRDRPFVVVDCGAIPAPLLESELFGYERGAFTGAVTARTGAFEAADGGTIFLDEIGELSLDLQPKILRALEGRKVKRVGSNEYLPVNVRVIAATNRNLREEVAARRFRSDLYYRLAVLHIKLPALRERKSDLPVLVAEVIEQLGLTGSEVASELCRPEFIEQLRYYDWPGNVRQLRNYLERRIALGAAIAPPGSETPLPPHNHDSDDNQLVDIEKPLKLAREEWVHVFESRYLDALLRRHANNVTAAARAAGVNRVHFHRLLRKYGLRDASLRGGEDE